MTPYIHAKSATELNQQLEDDWASINHRKVSKAEWSERCQLKAFVEAGARQNFFCYPLQIWHTSAANPDFKLCSSGFTVGIEVSRIAVEPLLRLRKLHHDGKTSAAVAISPLLIASGPMNNDCLIARTTPGAQTGDGWNDCSDERRFGLDSTLNVITRKTRIRRKPDYQDYGNNWLVLWDELSLQEREFDARARLLQSALRSYWNEERGFDKIILQGAELKHHRILSSPTRKGTAVSGL